MQKFKTHKCAVATYSFRNFNVINGRNDLIFLQIRHIRQQEGSNSHAVQQGEVSSSNPNILSNDQVGPVLLEVQFNLNRIPSIYSILVAFVH